MAPKARQLDEEKIVKLYLDGKTQNELVVEFKTCPVLIRAILKKYDLDTKMNTRKASSEYDARVLELIGQHKKMGEIADELNISRDIVRRIAKDHGIDIVQERNAYYLNRIRELSEKEYSVAQIAKELDVSISYVQKNIAKLGLKTRKEYNSDKVIALHKEGKGVVAIADTLRMSTRTVNKILQENNLK